MTIRTTILWASILAVGLLLGSCRERAQAEPRTARTQQLVSAEGYGISGVVSFHELDGAVRVEANVEGLPPGAHGIHVHEVGDCSLPDFTTAGDHFDPDDQPHGPPGPGSHAGDLGNLMAGPDGNATLSLVVPDISLDPRSERSILGRALIIHANPDDLVSQPAGDAGPRIACGIIRQAR